jgi:hypothetical protein
MQSRNAIRQRFPSSVEVLDSSSIGGSGIWSNGNSIEIGSRSLLKNGENGAVRVVFATFNQLDQLLEPATSSRYGTANGTAGTDSTCFSPLYFPTKTPNYVRPSITCIVFLRLSPVRQFEGDLCIPWQTRSPRRAPRARFGDIQASAHHQRLFTRVRLLGLPLKRVVKRRLQGR